MNTENSKDTNKRFDFPPSPVPLSPDAHRAGTAARRGAAKCEQRQTTWSIAPDSGR